MSRPVEVEFTVRLRVNPGVEANHHALRRLRGDLVDLLVDAGTGDVGDPDRALCAETPDDDGDDTFAVSVGAPRVDLLEVLGHPQTMVGIEDHELALDVAGRPSQP